MQGVSVTEVPRLTEAQWKRAVKAAGYNHKLFTRCAQEAGVSRGTLQDALADPGQEAYAAKFYRAWYKKPEAETKRMRDLVINGTEKHAIAAYNALLRKGIDVLPPMVETAAEDAIHDDMDDTAYNEWLEAAEAAIGPPPRSTGGHHELA